MTKDGIIKLLLAVLLGVYLVFALSFTSQMAATDKFKSVRINVEDSTSRRFVSAQDIDFELDTISRWIKMVSHSEFNTLDIEKRLLEKDNIEKVNCAVLNDGSLSIDVTPLIPVARVFDASGSNYYINRSGKRMKASIRYSMDTPVITGDFSGSLSPTLAFPLLDYLDTDPDMAAITSSVHIANNGDLIWVPSLKGHVVNIGDAADLPNKVARIKVFYREVMPKTGWEYYDTLSVKWRGQLVAKRRNKKAEAPPIEVEEHIDLDDESTMMAKTVDTAPQP